MQMASPCKSNWQADDFKSFWSHYNAVQTWIKVSEGARNTAINDFEWKLAENEVQSLLNLPPTTQASHANSINPSAIASILEISKTAVDVVHQQLECMDCVDGQASQSHIEEEEEMSPEMVAFFKVSLEHRQQREKQRQLEEKEKKKQQNSDKTWLNEEESEYVLASDIGIHGANKQTVQSPNKKQEVEEYKNKMRKIYGKDDEKIMAMEMAHDFKFNQHMGKHNPCLWPNIPVRFS